jgi:ankyrin repeat protein
MRQVDWDLSNASMIGDLEKVKRAIENGADVNVKRNGGWTPLRLASSHGHKAVVSLLLEKGANVDAKSDSGDTPLHDVPLHYC